MRDKSLESKLLFAQNAISNALNNEPITTAMNVYGYGETRLNEGMALYTSASGLHKKQKKEYGEQYAATDALYMARAEANADYIVHLNIARIALKDNRSADESLQLNGKRKESLSGWLEQCKAFYNNMLTTPDYLTAMAAFNITTDKLESSKTKMLDVETKYNQQLKETGEAQNATKIRDTAFDKMQEWIADFISIARIALAGTPQYLEMLGIVEPS